MLKLCLLSFAILFLCLLSSPSQTRHKRPKAPTREPVGISVDLVNQMARDDRAVSECVTNGGATIIARALSAKPFNLNGSGRSVVLVDLYQVPNVENCLLCGARRCDEWVYRKNGSSYELLLKIESADGVQPLRTSTNGYRDLKVTYVGSVSGDALAEIYKYDGRRYRKVR